MIASSSSRNSSKNMPRFSSNDMVHNHYLDVAKKKIQERDRNSTNSVPTSARIQTTTDDSKANPRSKIKHLGVCLYLRVVALRYAVDSIGKVIRLFAQSKVDNEPPHGSKLRYPNIHACKNKLGLVQLADLFTKALSEDRFKYLVRQLGMRCLTPNELEVLAIESA
ncbi:hypothetical protein Tco_1345182 [Tanacetum coccineum]